MAESHWGWAGTIAEFLDTDQTTWVDSLIHHHRTRLTELPLGPDQVTVWHEVYQICRATLASAVEADPTVNQCLLVAEYELPGEAGRRPDVCIITPTGHLLVLEFKAKPTAALADYDQVLAYVRDLVGYQSMSHNLEPHPILVLTKANVLRERPYTHDNVEVDRPVDQVLQGVRWRLLTSMRETVHPLNPLGWLSGEYEPIPSLVAAAAETFRNHDLPAIKNLQHLNDLVDWVHTLIDECEREKKYALILLSGAPGTGKTLVGLQTVADQNFSGRSALWLSGNGPLVGVMQDCINRLHHEKPAKTMVRGMMEFKKWALPPKRYAPANIYVFDEGQRAWTEVSGYWGTEIQLLVEVVQRRPWGVLIGLIGDGQEIYQREHGDRQKWVTDFLAAPRQSRWEVYSPTADLPPGDYTIHVNPALYLDKSVRSKQVLTLHRWVNSLLAGDAAPVVAEQASSTLAPITHHPYPRNQLAAGIHRFRFH